MPANRPETAGPAADSRTDDLPAREPRTPEDAEDEALRGDFMLRWALVLLALLIGCTAIAETQTLVHVKSGQYTLENFLPARTGIYSATAEDRPWHNLSWLFDVALAGVYAAGGAVGLSIFKAVLAAVIFGTIVHTNRKDVSTWWGTICAGLALIVAHRHLTARPEIVTLLGLAVTLWLLHRWREERQAKYLKGLLVVFLLWSNMDPGMFYGLAVLVFYAVGETAGNWLGYSGLDNDTHRRQLWLAVGGCVAVTLLNPSGWNALLAPVIRYSTEYRHLQAFYPLGGNYSFVQLQYYPVWQPEFWEKIDAAAVAGLVLAVAALISFVLNFRRLDFGDFLVWLAFVAFAAIATHEMAAAAVVSAVLATWNAQQWYQHTFRQTYSVETSELLFSSGGRAVTVLAMFGLACLSISGVGGWLQRRTDLGFDPNLQAAIDSFETELKDSFDDRPFNFVLWQGDVLVWIGQKPFIDSRLPLYAGQGADDLIQLHKDCRSQLRRADRPGSAGREWKPTLDRFHITHVVPRMDSRVVKAEVGYDVFFVLLRSLDWQLVRFGATAAVFYRTDRADRRLAAYLARNRTDFVKDGFRTTSPDLEVRFDWARGKSLTEKWIRRPRDSTPNSVELAKNYLTLMAIAAAGRFPRMEAAVASDPASLVAAFAHLVLRNANAGLEENPQNANAYQLLGHAYSLLADVEQSAVRQGAKALAVRAGRSRSLAIQFRLGVGGIRQRRYRQAAAALQQALIISPDDETALQLLAHLQHSNDKLDLAVENYERYIELLDRRDDLSKREQEFRENIVRRKENVQKTVAAVRDGVEQEKKGLGDDEASRKRRYEIARRVMESGCVKMAIDLIEEDRDLVGQDAEAAYFYVDLLQQAGRAREAFEQLQKPELPELKRRFLERRPRPNSWRSLEAFAALARADYAEAERVWKLTVEELERQQLPGLMSTLPFSMRSPLAVGRGLQSPGMWITEHTQALESSLHEIPFTIAQLKLQIALTQLETGRPQRAAETFREMVQIAPESPLRRLGGFYLLLLTGERLPPLPPPKKTATPKPTGTSKVQRPVEAAKPKPP